MTIMELIKESLPDLDEREIESYDDAVKVSYEVDVKFTALCEHSEVSAERVRQRISKLMRYCRYFERQGDDTKQRKDSLELLRRLKIEDKCTRNVALHFTYSAAIYAYMWAKSPNEGERKTGEDFLTMLDVWLFKTSTSSRHNISERVWQEFLTGKPYAEEPRSKPKPKAKKQIAQPNVKKEDLKGMIKVKKPVLLFAMRYLGHVAFMIYVYVLFVKGKKSGDVFTTIDNLAFYTRKDPDVVRGAIKSIARHELCKVSYEGDTVYFHVKEF